MPQSNHVRKHSDHLFGIEILRSGHPAIRKLKKSAPSSLHGNKLWASSFLLMDYLASHPLAKSDRVFEIGCGWGLASIFINNRFGCAVTALDADAAVFPYLDLHAEINHATVKTRCTRFERISTRELQACDVLVAADVCFWDELEEIHFRLINRAIAAGVKKIIYADPERPPFIALAERCMEHHFAEIHGKELETPVSARGCLMVIENA